MTTSTTTKVLSFEPFVITLGRDFVNTVKDRIQDFVCDMKNEGWNKFDTRQEWDGLVDDIVEEATEINHKNSKHGFEDCQVFVRTMQQYRNQMIESAEELNDM